MATKRTMATFSYGFTEPADLLAKMEREGAKLKHPADRDDVFNFIVTAAALGEWVQKHYDSLKKDRIFGFDEKSRVWVLPDGFEAWIADTSCFRNGEYWLRENITDALTICHHVCNATKHFHWNDGGKIDHIGDEAAVNSWGGYFFDSVAPDTYVRLDDANYGVRQLYGILSQFYRGLIAHLEEVRRSPSDS